MQFAGTYMFTEPTYGLEAATPRLPSYPNIEDVLCTVPSFQDFLLGRPFAGGDAGHDAARLAERLLADHVSPEADHAVLADTLLKLRLLHAPGLCLAAAEGCRAVVALRGTGGDMFAESAKLFAYFAAALGSKEAALYVASEASTLAECSTGDEASEVRAVALGWLIYANAKSRGPFREARSHVMAAVERITDRMGVAPSSTCWASPRDVS